MEVAETVTNLLDQLPGTGSFIAMAVVLGLGPILAVIITSFLKISVVIMLLRNALGLQDVPSNLAINSLALILSMYIMAPVGWDIAQRLSEPEVDLGDMTNTETQEAIGDSLEAIRGFLERNARDQHKEFFATSARKLWGDELGVDVQPDDLMVLIPAFTTSELSAAFEVAFLLYLPFIAIDLIVANILLALGMIMLSPLTISLPFKLLLFVVVDGWTRLLQSLILSYS